MVIYQSPCLLEQERKDVGNEEEGRCFTNTMKAGLVVSPVRIRNTLLATHTSILNIIIVVNREALKARRKSRIHGKGRMCFDVAMYWDGGC